MIRFSFGQTDPLKQALGGTRFRQTIPGIVARSNVPDIQARGRPVSNGYVGFLSRWHHRKQSRCAASSSRDGAWFRDGAADPIDP